MEHNDSLMAQLSGLVDRDVISMGWDPTKEGIVYFLTPTQRETAEGALDDLTQYLPDGGKA